MQNLATLKRVDNTYKKTHNVTDFVFIVIYRLLRMKNIFPYYKEKNEKQTKKWK